MDTIAKVGMVQTPAEHERLAVRGRNVAGGLFEAMLWLIGVLIRQRGLAAEPGVRWQWEGIETLVAAIDNAAIQPHVLSLGPGHDPLPDNVEQHSPVVIVAAVSRRIQKLADLNLHTVA